MMIHLTSLLLFIIRDISSKKITLENFMFICFRFKGMSIKMPNINSVTRKIVFCKQLRSQFPFLSTRKEGNCGVFGRWCWTRIFLPLS